MSLHKKYKNKSNSLISDDNSTENTEFNSTINQMKWEENVSNYLSCKKNRQSKENFDT